MTPSVAEATDPVAGYYEMQEIKGGQLVALRVWIEDGEREMCGGCMGVGDGDGLYHQCEYCGGIGSFLMSDQLWCAELNGDPVAPDAVFKVWLRGRKRRPISEAEYRYRSARSRHGMIHRGVERYKPIDLLNVEPPFRAGDE